jgi:hypothetical protein
MQAYDRVRILKMAIEIFNGLPEDTKREDGPVNAIKMAAGELHVCLPDDVVNERTARKSELVRELEYQIHNAWRDGWIGPRNKAQQGAAKE